MSTRISAKITLSISLLLSAVYVLMNFAGKDSKEDALVILITLFLVNSVLAVLGKEHERLSTLSVIYIASLGMAGYFLFSQSLGPDVHWLMHLITSAVIPAYVLFELLWEYIHARDIPSRNRLKYVLLGVAGAYVIGYMPIGMWSMIFIFFIVLPLGYAVFWNELLDIRAISRNSLIYAVSIVSVSSLILLLNATNNWLLQSTPGFPNWLFPLITACIVVGVSVSIWRKMREADMLRYEFITTATHKLRTPLTHIRWATESLSQMANSEEVRSQLQYIQSANGKLVELSNILMNVSDTDNSLEYLQSENDLSALANEVIESLKYQFESKKISLTKTLEPKLMVEVETERIRFIIQTLTENAIHYTPDGGNITLSVKRDGKHATFSIKDSGIGLDDSDKKFLFSKFYRSKRAREADTEGMGIGLYISKEIIKRHHGKIWAESEGANMGSTFSFSLPAL